MLSEFKQQELLRVLGKNFLFQGLSAEQIAVLVQSVELEYIDAGTTIVYEGDQAESLYIVVEGGVNVLKGEKQFLASLGPGGFFGEMALFLEGSLRSASCQAIMDTTCVKIRRLDLDRFCDQHPRAGLQIYRAIIRTLAERLHNTSEDLAFLMGTQVRTQEEVSKLVQRVKGKEKSEEGSES